jgi:hypothetical protein
MPPVSRCFMTLRTLDSSNVQGMGNGLVGANALSSGNWLSQLKRLPNIEEDVEFGFEKALNQRGISSSLMYEVVSMWNWILEEGLEDFDDYAQYGLPLFKATAVKYGFDNPIGDDSGDESHYASD